MACSNGISVFFSMPPPLPSSTLFPYTTLFRSQELSPAVKPRHHRPDRNAHHLGDLFIGEPLHIEEDRGPELLRQGRERLFHLARDDPIEEFLLRIRGIRPSHL